MLRSPDRWYCTDISTSNGIQISFVRRENCSLLMGFVYLKKAVLIKFKIIQVNKKLKQYPVQFLFRFNKSKRHIKRPVNFTAEMVHRYQGMISLDYDSIHHVDELLRQIRIKESQLKIAQESNMVYTAQALEKQILKLQQKLSESRDPEIHALMSLLDD